MKALTVLQRLRQLLYNDDTQRTCLEAGMRRYSSGCGSGSGQAKRLWAAGIFRLYNLILLSTEYGRG